MSARPFAATNLPGTCKWCGRKLRWVCNTTYERTSDPPRRCGRPDFSGLEGAGNRCDSTKITMIDGAWTCGAGHTVHGHRRIIKSRVRRYEKAGSYGDGHFCNLTCSYRYAVAMANSGQVLVSKPRRPV